MSNQEKAVLLAWHKEFSGLEKVGLQQASNFCRLFNRSIEADVNNERCAMRLESISVTRGAPVFYKDQIVQYCGRA